MRVWARGAAAALVVAVAGGCALLRQVPAPDWDPRPDPRPEPADPEPADPEPVDPEPADPEPVDWCTVTGTRAVPGLVEVYGPVAERTVAVSVQPHGSQATVGALKRWPPAKRERCRCWFQPGGLMPGQRITVWLWLEGNPTPASRQVVVGWPE